MRAFLPLALAAALSGCATHDARVARAPDRPASSDWAAVRAIRANTYVFAVLDDSHYGYGPLERATDTTLTIRGLPAIPRDTVVRVETMGPITRDGSASYGLGAVAVGGFAGYLTGVALDNAKVKGWSAAVLSAGLVAGFVYMARHTPPKADHGTRVVYVRR